MFSRVLSIPIESIFNQRPFQELKKLEVATILIRPFFRAKRLNLRKKLFPSSTVLAPNMVQYLYFRLLTFPADFSTSSVIDFTSHAGAICRRCFSARSLALLGTGWRFWLGKKHLVDSLVKFWFLIIFSCRPIFGYFFIEQLMSGYVLLGIQIHLRPLKIESFQGSIPKVETQTDKKNWDWLDDRDEEFKPSRFLDLLLPK